MLELHATPGRSLDLVQSKLIKTQVRALRQCSGMTPDGLDQTRPGRA